MRHLLLQFNRAFNQQFRLLHFDGKLLAHQIGPKRDCLPIVVSGLNVEKLLGIPMLPVRTGVMMGNKVVEFVRDWSDA